MGISPPPLQQFDSDSSLWSKVLEAQAKRRIKVKKQRMMTRRKVRHVRCKRPRSILMKRRCRRRENSIDKKVETLKKLIPNNNESMGLDGLFRETADYILSLQMRVKVMQIMVEVFTGSKE
ncbi:hypothetical protein PTKIN_Ptkin17bG0091000 [Pterospermum kingtungense]